MKEQYQALCDAIDIIQTAIRGTNHNHPAFDMLCHAKFRLHNEAKTLLTYGD